MADYKAIHGKNIQSLASDLDTAEAEGQIWFNTATSDYKTITKVAGTWSTSHAMNTARYDFGSANSSPASTGLTIGGHPTTHKSIVEEYNGTSWSEEADLASGRKQAAGFGISTAAALVGGSQPGGPKRLQETWDGSSWSEDADLNVGADAASNNAFGTTTAAVFVGGARELSPSLDDSVELWNGTAWTEIADLNGDGLQYGVCMGISTAGLAISGDRSYPSPAFSDDDVEEWNGSSWTEVGDINDARGGQGGGGTATFGVIWGGISPATVGVTELWDGTSWTEVADLSTARGYMGGNGAAASSAIAVGGTPPTVANVEEWKFSSTLAAGAWAAANNINTARAEPGSAASGPQDASAIFGGNTGSGSPGYTDIHEQYDGSSWSEEVDLNTVRTFGGGVGIQTAALYITGVSPETNNHTELWNGTSWTEVGDTNTVGKGAACAGTTTACIKAGGADAPGTTDKTETWNGASWTEAPDLNAATTYAGGAGTSTAALCMLGQTPGAPIYDDKCESWNGTAWSEINDANTGRYAAAAFGTQTSALYAGGAGSAPANVAVTEDFDGVSFTEVADLNTARSTVAGSGTTSSGVIAGGYTDANVATTEEWTKPQNVEVITD